MAVAGIPIPAADHVVRAAHGVGHDGRAERLTLQMRIGIDTGAVVAGVIGKRKFIYDLWGDAVNTASQMESHGVAGRIQVTGTTRQRLGGPFMLESRGAIDVKGKGEMRTWFLTSMTSSHPI